MHVDNKFYSTKQVDTRTCIWIWSLTSLHFW